MPRQRFTPIALALSTLFSTAVFAADNSITDNNKQDDIVISASRIESSRIETGSSITVLDAQYLQQNQARTVAEVLRDVPGVSVASTGGMGQATSVFIRGAGSNKTLVIIDGIEVNDLSKIDGGYSFSHLMTDNIERIEVLKGSQSALWGSDAMGGVINIITKKGKVGFNPTANIEIGGNRYHKESINLSGATEKSHYSLSASNLDSDGISSKTRQLDDPDDDSYENQTVTLTAGHQFSELFSVDGTLRYSNAKSEYDEDAFNSAFPFNQIENFIDIYAKNRQRLAKLNTYLNLFEGHWKNRLSVSFSDSNNLDHSSYSSDYEGQKVKTDLQSDYYFETINNYTQRLSFIAEHENNSYKTWAMGKSERIEASGVVLGYGVDWAKTIFVNAAIRRDFNSKFDDTTTYHVDTSAWLNDGTRFHASYGTGVKNPSLGQLYGFSPSSWGPAFDYSGNPNLQPEKSRSWDAGIEYNFATIDAYIDLTYFDSKYTDMHKYQSNSYINLDDQATARGIEFSGSMKVAKDLRVNAGYTYMESNDGTTARSELLRRPQHAASLNANYKYTTNLSANIGVRYVGSRLDYGNVDLDDYTVINIGAQYQVHPHIAIYGRIENAFDEDYADVTNYGTDPLTAYLGVSFK